jgi:CheY-like chemotaxis protein
MSDTTPANRELRVLVVDDDRDNADSFSMVLSLWGKRGEGYAVRVAYDGPEAARIASTWLPDVALLDLAMPNVDGLELGQLLRDLPYLERLPLIAVTGHAGAAYRMRAEALGFSGYLLKPVAPPALRLLLDKVRTDRAVPREETLPGAERISSLGDRRRII